MIVLGSSRKKIKRRPKATPSEWFITKQKKLRKERKEYLVPKTVDGKTTYVKRPAKARRPRCISQYCREIKNNCHKFSETDLESIKNSYVELPRNDQIAFIQKCVTISEPKRRQRKNRNAATEPRRKQSRVYKLKLGDHWEKVCLKTFKNTLILTDSTIKLALSKTNAEGMPVTTPKPRGKGGAGTESYNRRFDHMRDFIEKTEKMESHYCRATTMKKFFHSAIESISQLHRYYVAECTEKPLSIATFRNYLKKQKYTVFRRKSDLCNTCVGFKNRITPTKTEKDKYDKHRKNKTLARLHKQNDKNNKNDSVAVFTVDTQSQLYLPRTNANAFYFRNKQILHNWTSFNLKTLHVINYLWTECSGKLDGSAYASLYVDLITNEVAKNHRLKEIILWSDGCNAQNRCSTLSGALLALSVKLSVVIIQKYLEVGHTQMEADSVHARIEKQIKAKQEIYTPEDYEKLIKNARMKPAPYETKMLDYKFFDNYDTVNTISSIRPGEDKPGEDQVHDIRAIKYENSQIYTKVFHDNEWTPLDEVRDVIVPEKNPPKSFRYPLKLSSTKWKHLTEMKELGVIPDDAWDNYYSKLPHQ